MWLDLFANSLMSLDPNPSRRIWMVLDELPTLQRLPYLMDAFAESRKFGGCLVAGMQSMAQLRKIYGNNAAEELSSLCNTRIFFREPSFEMAAWVSKELGQSETEEVREGISYGESAMRSGVSLSKQLQNRQIVSASDILSLENLAAYVRVPGRFPIAKIIIPYRERNGIAHSFQRKERVPLEAFPENNKTRHKKPVDEEKSSGGNSMTQISQDINSQYPAQPDKITEESPNLSDLFLEK
jgi:type IV secretory pathway TraG/TraD family ATPase VirD4